jgi:hypothetical protein
MHNRGAERRRDAAKLLGALQYRAAARALACEEWGGTHDEGRFRGLPERLRAERDV